MDTKKTPHVVVPDDPSTWRGGLSAKGWEMPDPRPMSIAIKSTPPPTLHDLLAHIVRGELSRRAAAEGIETFDEADDFDVGDDYDPRSPHELDEEQFHAPFPAPAAAPGPAAAGPVPAPGPGAAPAAPVPSPGPAAP